MLMKSTRQKQSSVLPRINRGLLSGERNGRWLGDKASLDAIHKHVRKLKGMTGTCEWCGETPPMRREDLPGKRFRMVSGTDLHSLTGEYTRDPDEYVEICRACHTENHKPSIRVYRRRDA